MARRAVQAHAAKRADDHNPWDADSGQYLWTAIHLPNGELATIDEANQRVLHASPEAWRYLGWRWRDPATGRWRILPAEHFGPLPS